MPTVKGGAAQSRCIVECIGCYFSEKFFKSGKTDSQQAAGFCRKWRKGSRQVSYLICMLIESLTFVYLSYLHKMTL